MLRRNLIHSFHELNGSHIRREMDIWGSPCDGWTLSETAAACCIAACLQSGPFFPTSVPPAFRQAVSKKWSEAAERKLSLELSQSVHDTTALFLSRKPSCHDFSLPIAIVGRMVANDVTAGPTADMSVMALHLGAAQRRRLLSGVLKTFQRVGAEKISVWSRQSFLNSFASTPFVCEPKFEPLVRLLVCSLSPDESREALTKEGAVFHYSPKLHFGGGVGHVVAVAWQSGVPIPNVLSESSSDWETATAKLGPDIVKFAIDVEAQLPKTIQEAYRIAACGPSGATSSFQAEIIDGLVENLSARFARRWYMSDTQTHDAAVIALPSLFKDRRWEEALLAAAETAKGPEPFPNSDQRSLDEFEWAKRHNRQEFANTVAQNGGRFEVWSALFQKWGVRDHIVATSGPWAEIAETRSASESLTEIINRLLVPNSEIVPHDINRVASAFSEEDPEIRPLIATTPDPEGELKYRRKFLFGLIVEAAPRVTPILLIIGLSAMGGRTRGRAVKGLRRMSKSEPHKYAELLTKLPKEFRQRLEQITHPIYAVLYKIVDRKLERLKRGEETDLNFQGYSGSHRGDFTLLHVEGHGSSHRIKKVTRTYATDVSIDSAGNVKTFTGDTLRKIAGRVRTLTPVEAEMVRYACRPCCSESEVVISEATKSVQKIIDYAHVDPMAGFGEYMSKQLGWLMEG